MADNKVQANKQPTEVKSAAALSPPDPLKFLLQKKMSYLKRKIILGLATFAGLIIVATIVFLYYQDVKKTGEMQIKKVLDYLSNVKNKTNDIQLKITDAKKYKEIWKNTKTTKKNFDGININDVNSKFTELSERYHLNNPSIKISVPEALKGGIFDRSTVNVSLSSVSISFDALTDAMAIDFVKDFTDILPGYIVITEFDIKKTSDKPFSQDDLVSISTGKFVSGVNTKLDFSWYILKKKSGTVK